MTISVVILDLSSSHTRETIRYGGPIASLPCVILAYARSHHFLSGFVEEIH